MKQYCRLTGVDLSTDGASNGIKGMCLNCKSCCGDEDFTCTNENVLAVGRNKIMESLPEGFEIDTLTLKPMKLKDPTKKCKNYSCDMDKITAFLEKWFGVDENAEKENASE